jgi:long-chain acyl-CoA synthetase
VVVAGDKKPFVSALITLDGEMLPTWLGNNGVEATLSLSEAARHPVVLEEVQRAIDAANERVSRAESIRKFHILPVELTEATGHLTPKMSIKRQVILNDFAAEIEALYAGAGTEPITTVG